MDLAELKGVGPTTEERLRSAGIENVDELAQANVNDLTDTGLSESKANRLLTRAAKHGVVLQTGDDVVKEIEDKELRSTGMEALDDVLGGGFREDHIVGVAGESSAGKTQLAFQALVTAVEETDTPAVYIETERGRYEPERIAQLADESDTQEQVYRVKAYSLEQQLLAYQKVADQLEDVSLVVVDSFTARFRLSDRFEDRSSLQARSKEFGKHLNEVEDLIEAVGAPVLLTLQIYGNPSAYSSGASTYGGELLNHTVSYFLKMAIDKGSLREATLQGHPGEQDDSVYLSIENEQLKAMKEA